MSINKVSTEKLIALDRHPSSTTRGSGRSENWDRNVETVVKIIQTYNSFPKELKQLASQVEKAHKLYLIARTNYKLEDCKNGRAILGVALGVENVEARINEAKNKFLKAEEEEEERNLVLKLKEAFNLWYENEGREIVKSKGLLAELFDKEITNIETAKNIFENIFYTLPKKSV